MKALNARGRRVVGGRIIGRILAFAAGGGGTLNGLTGYAGVPNPGEDDGIGFKGAGVEGALNMGAALGFSSRFGRDIAVGSLNRGGEDRKVGWETRLGPEKTRPR